MRSALPAVIAASLSLFAQNPADFVADAGVVLVSVTATDRDGNFVSDLRLEDFVLEDNGKPRTIENLWREDATPLTIGLIADTSGSQASVIPAHQRALTQFLSQVLRPQDRAFLISIPYNVRMLVDVNQSASELQNGVNKLHSRTEKSPQFGEPCTPFKVFRKESPCTSPLWNAVRDAAVLRMQQAEGRKALILLSDGMDVKSQHTLTDAIEAAQRAGSPVYTIPTGGFLVQRLLGRGKSAMSKLSAETGGRSHGASDDAGFKKIFDEIETELRNTYILAFTAPAASRDREFHKLKVSSKRRGVTIRTRSGYFADR